MAVHKAKSGNMIMPPPIPSSPDRNPTDAPTEKRKNIKSKRHLFPDKYFFCRFSHSLGEHIAYMSSQYILFLQGLDKLIFSFLRNKISEDRPDVCASFIITRFRISYAL